MGFRCGIVGLPNVGKSTLFNALTETQAAQAANYPFCTIEPNIGNVGVPDPRLDELARIAGSQKIIPTQLGFVDIAGLVRGASKGEGLGNQFLGNIREVDAIVHVLRCFENVDIQHVDNKIDPISDAETVETELMLSDLESLEKRVPAAQKKAAQGDKEARITASVLGEEEAAGTGNDFSARVFAKAKAEGANAVIVSAAIEADIVTMPVEDRAEFLSALGLEEAGLAKIIRSGYELLHLLTFFTVGPKEARAWTVHAGAKAPEAAGEIHSDMQRGFIRAETIAYEDFVTLGGEAAARDAGKLRQEGKEYVVRDGDVMHFKFNV
jgi:small GTP-binding protein